MVNHLQIFIQILSSTYLFCLLFFLQILYEVFHMNPLFGISTSIFEIFLQIAFLCYFHKQFMSTF
jgi:hypothetical protein